MSYCDVNPSPTNQSTNMDDSVDSGIVRRSLRSNVRCNYKDMANGTKKTTNTVNNDIDRSRSLSATRKIKIKPVIRKSEQTSTGCTQNHNCVNNLTHKAKSISQNNTTDDESSITSHPSPSVSPETNNHGNEICNLTGANNKRNRRPPSAHKDYLNEKQVKEIQKSRSKNSSKSHTPDPSHITKGFDNSNNSVKSNHEITNEVMKKLNSELKIEINKNHIIEPRNSISPPIRMSITRGRGSVSPKIISCTVNAESDGVVNSNNDIPFNNKFNVESEIKKCPENNSIIQETTEVVQKEKVQEIVEKNVIVSEGPCSKIVSNVLPILEKEKPLVKIEVPEVNEEVSIRHDDNIGDKFKEECPTLACMEVVSDPPKLDIEEINDPKPILEPVIIEPLKPLENSNSADGSGPPLLEPVPEGPQEDSFEDLDLKCHEDLELIDIDLPKSEAIEIKEEVVESTTVNSKQTKGYTFRNANKNNDSKSSIKRSYNKNSNKYKCSECGFNGSKMADLKMHAKTHSNSNNRGGKRRKVDDSGSKNDSDIKDTSGGNDDLVDQETKNIKLNTLYTVDETDRGDGFEKLYRCKECPFTNSTIPRIENHVLGHTKRLGFKCPVCTYFCGSAGFMKKHTILHGDDCPWPPQFYGARKGGNSRYYTPNKVETKKEETLSPTNATTENSHVTDNMRTVWKYFMIQKKIKQKTCHVKKCQFKGTAMSCILHKLFYHKEVQGTLKKSIKKKNISKVCKKGKKVSKNICKDCKRKFTNKKILEYHRIISSNCKNSNNIKLIKMVVEAPDIIKEHNGSFYCLECPFVAGQLEVVETHANGHLEKFSYICDKCQWTTDDNEELKLHEQCHSFEMVNDENEESVGEKLMWNCEECPYKSLDVYEMRSHTRLHQGKRSQKCGQCTFSCDTPGTLSQHIQVHGKVSKRGKPKRNNIKRENITDKVISKDIMTKNENGVPVKALKLVVKSVNLKEPYEMHKCETCPYYASSEDSIFKHVALHNSPKGNKKMHECLNCKFWCDSNEMLLDHIKVHNNAFNIPYFIQTLFACKNCDFTCSEESVLKLHEQKLNCTSNKRPVRGRKRKLADDEDTPVTENSTREVSIDDADSMTLDDWLKEYHKKFGLPRGIIEIKTKAVAKERPRHNVLDLYSSRINCQVDDYYKCDKCPFTTKFEPVMRGHEVHHIHPQQHSCSLCSYSVNDVRNLISHLKWHETDNGFGEIDKKSTLKKNDPYREINCHPGMDAYECPFNPCTFRTSFAHTINSHITEHAKKHKLRILTGLKRKNIDCQKNDKTFKPPKESKNPLMCSDCQFSTHFSDEIVDHNESHKDPFLEYQCTLCTFASDSLVSLSTHFTDHHTEEVKGKENDLTNLNERQKRFKTYLEHLIQVTPV